MKNTQCDLPPHTVVPNPSRVVGRYTWGLRDSSKVYMYNLTREEAERIAAVIPGMVAAPIETKRYSPDRRSDEIGHGIEI